MTKHEHHDDVVIDLGSVTNETLGQAAIGSVDTQQGAFYPLGGIEAND